MENKYKIKIRIRDFVLLIFLGNGDLKMVGLYLEKCDGLEAGVLMEMGMLKNGFFVGKGEWSRTRIIYFLLKITWFNIFQKLIL
jgi:hypothetical protein